MRHRRALELPLQESAIVPAPQPAPAPLRGDLLRGIDGGAEAPATAPAQLWLAVLLAASPSQPASEDLERLAVRAQRLTPRVSLDPPDGLLLEVKGSLHLFGGVEGVSREMAAECSRLRMRGTLAMAPTPLAALALARAGRSSLSSLIVTDPAQLVGKLSPLPLATLRWSPEVLGRLARIGVRTIGEALRLPRAGFARRFGTAQLQTLDRLVGRAGDLKDRFEVRARFRRRRELLYELESQAALMAVLVPLLGELGEFLQARQCGVLALECRLRHRTVPPTRCVLRLAAPAADPAQLAALLRERLSAVVLPEPVRACELRSGQLVPRVLACGGLWQPGERGGGVAAQAPDLIERLRARLGTEAVYGLQVIEDHRPEAAWSISEPVLTPATAQSARGSPSWRSSCGQDHIAIRAEADDQGPFDRRPLWLLPVPRQLGERDGLPRRRGTLRLLGEAQRIETGWWDGGEIARDYYTAVDARGALLWVFREREPPHRWFLHGVFG
jgi:protein ImuB